MDISFNWVVPVLRIFDIDKADTFYQGFLGFKVDWDHRFEPNAPLYRQISRGNLILHLSEHHADGSPGARIRVMMHGVGGISPRDHLERLPLYAPGLETTAWGTLETGVIDPFGNPIRFCQPVDRPATA
jgi:catechol 2,3-dioxygenase-like lactoylglutathione lyase family enzyme